MPPLPDTAADEDVPDNEEHFLCNCKHYNGNPCSSMFAPGELSDMRLNYAEMTRDQLDIAVLAKLACGMHLSKETQRSRKRTQTERKAQRTDFFHHGHKICRDTFKYLHGIGQDRLNNLIKHYKENRVTTRQHGNKKRRPANAIKAEDNIYVAHFLMNYAETYA